jgi:predicted GIY-YIG superfamily endonuclease
MPTTNIYILKLQGGRYYIGKSDNVSKRYEQHLNGSGSSWTKKYKPISVDKIIPNASPFDEDKYTKEYMSKIWHG